MKKKSVVFLVVAVGIILAVVGAVYAFDKWQAAQPTKENFDKVGREIWEQNNRSQTLCIAVPGNPAPDSRSKARLPLAWLLDFFLDTAPTKNREQQIRKLDALAKVGLLQKTYTATEFNDDIRAVIHYSLTDKGWAASDYSRDTSCFVYGKSRYLGVSQFDSRQCSQ